MCGIVAAPEYIDQITVRNRIRIKCDLNRLGVVTRVVVSGALFCSPGVPDTGPRDPFDAPELSIGTPESAECEGGDLCMGCRRGGLNKRYSHEEDYNTDSCDDSPSA